MKVFVPKEISNKIFLAVKKSGLNEIKGALFAEKKDDNCFQIEDVYIGNEIGTTVFSRLTVNARYKTFKRKYFKKHNKDYINHNYIGDWHSHPLFKCVPSDYDKKELIDELKNSNALFLIQVILKIENERLCGNCFYCNKNDYCIKKCDLILEQ